MSGEVLLSRTSFSYSPGPDRLQSSILCQCKSIPLMTLIDSGADDNFIDSVFVREAEIPNEPFDPPRKVNAFNGEPLAMITHCTDPIPMLLQGNHKETNYW